MVYDTKYWSPKFFFVCNRRKSVINTTDQKQNSLLLCLIARPTTTTTRTPVPTSATAAPEQPGKMGKHTPNNSEDLRKGSQF